MKKPELIARVAAIATKLRDDGGRPPLGHSRAGWAMFTWNHIKRTEPGLVRHFEQYYRSDPYQIMKGWMPSWSEKG